MSKESFNVHPEHFEIGQVSFLCRQSHGYSSKWKIHVCDCEHVIDYRIGPPILSSFSVIYCFFNLSKKITLSRILNVYHVTSVFGCLRRRIPQGFGLFIANQIILFFYFIRKQTNLVAIDMANYNARFHYHPGEI